MHALHTHKCQEHSGWGVKRWRRGFAADPKARPLTPADITQVQGTGNHHKCYAHDTPRRAVRGKLQRGLGGPNRPPNPTATETRP